MVGPTDQETAAIEDTVTLSSQEEGAGHALGGGGGHGEAPASVRRKRRPEPSGGFCGKEWVRQGEPAENRLV